MMLSELIKDAEEELKIRGDMPVTCHEGSDPFDERPVQLVVFAEYPSCFIRGPRVVLLTGLFHCLMMHLPDILY